MRHAAISLALTVICMTLPAGGAMKKEGRKMGDLRISSPAFAEGGSIPVRYTCDGADVNPPLTIENVPEGARSLALVVDDPDAPMGMWVHWVVWNIDPQTKEIKESSVSAGASQGKNDWRRNSYGGPCPPSGTHRYFFKLYALDATLNLPQSAGKNELERAIQGHILAKAQLMGTYKRK
ncbi:MAG: PEBP family [Geobacteraceae bacterium]|nr:MAG: PEBP family [Geobacteraceae bacterium]